MLRQKRRNCIPLICSREAPGGAVEFFARIGHNVIDNSMAIKYLFYFFFGGIIVSTVTYFASHAKGLVAAFVANLPVVTLITFLTIYLESGQAQVISYAQGLLIMLVPWLAYIFAVIFLTPKIGFFPSILLGVFLYLTGAYLMISFRSF